MRMPMRIQRVQQVQNFLKSLKSIFETVLLGLGSCAEFLDVKDSHLVVALHMGMQPNQTQ